MENELKHWGVLGMKWGVRRYRNPNGSLTPEGKRRYGVSSLDSRGTRVANKFDKKIYKNEKVKQIILSARSKNLSRMIKKYDKKINRAIEYGNVDKIKKLQNKKTTDIKDFKDTTKFINAGYDDYSRVLSNYRNAKLKSFTDKAFKKDSQYKNAVIAYTNQVIYNLNYGKTGTPLKYASQRAQTSIRS